MKNMVWEETIWKQKNMVERFLKSNTQWFEQEPKVWPILNRKKVYKNNKGEQNKSNIFVRTKMYLELNLQNEQKIGWTNFENQKI